MKANAKQIRQVSLPTAELFDIIPQELGYPGCKGHSVPEPKIVINADLAQLQLSFGKSGRVIPLSLIREDVEKLIDAPPDGYDFANWLATTLFVNGQTYKSVEIWLSQWISAIIAYWEEANYELINKAPVKSPLPRYRPRGGELKRTDKPVYSCRTDKSMNARDFLEKHYAEELASQTITLSDVGKYDGSLSRGLRNWARAGGHDLDAIIPRGRKSVGSGKPVVSEGVSHLDPNDPRDALALHALTVRRQTRERVARHRVRQLKK